MVADPIGSSRLSDGGEFGLRRIEKKVSLLLRIRNIQRSRSAKQRH